MHNRVVVSALVLAHLLLPACLESNSPPTISIVPLGELEAAPPFYARFNVTATDSDGDAVQVFVTSNQPGSGKITLALDDSDWFRVGLEFAYPGNWTMSFNYTDGANTAQVDYVVRVLPIAPRLDANLWVTQACVLCPVERPYSSPPDTALGYNGCLHFRDIGEEHDCAWIEVLDDWKGQYITASSAGDPAIDFLTSCDPFAASRVYHVVNPGNELGVVPENGGCILVWDSISPGPIHVYIEPPPFATSAASNEGH